MNHNFDPHSSAVDAISSVVEGRLRRLSEMNPLNKHWPRRHYSGPDKVDADLAWVMEVFWKDGGYGQGLSDKEPALNAGAQKETRVGL